MKLQARGAACVIATLTCVVTVNCNRDERRQSGTESPAQQRSNATSRSTGRLESLLTKAESTYYRGEYDSARSQLNAALANAQRVADTAAQARALTWLGLTARIQGRYADARRWGEQALALKLRARLTADLSRSYNALGLLAHHQGRFSDAIELFTRAAESARAVRDSLGEAKAVGNLGLVYSDVGEFAKAFAGFESMRRTANSVGDRRVEANALNNLGMVAVRSGDPVAAVPSLERALELYRGISFPAGEENALGQLGTAYQARGDLRRAFAYFDSAIVIARKHGLRQQEVDDLGLIAELFGEAGDHTRALEYLSRADSANRDLDMQSEAGDIARAQAYVYGSLGRLDLARERIATATQRHGSAGALLERLRDELFSAELSERSGRKAEASTMIAAAHRTADRLGHSMARVELALGEARVLDAANDPRGVLRVLRRARTDSSSVGQDRAWQVDALEARAHARLGLLADAAASGRAAMSKVERVRSSLGPGSLRSSYTADKARVYSDLAVVLLRQGKVDQAFEVADAARGRALVEHISTAGQELRARTPRDLAEADQLLRRIDVLMEQLRTADTTSQRERSRDAESEFDNLSRSLANARREYELSLQRIARTDPSAAKMLGVAPFEAAGVRQWLGATEALVEYFVTPDRLLTFVVTRAGTRSFQSAVPEADLVARVRLARDLAATPRGNAGARRATLVSLHDLLVAPLERSGALTGFSRLIVVPHGALVYLPMAALVNRATGRSLIEDYSLLGMPAASGLAAVRSAPHVPNGAITVLAPFPDELPGTREESRTLGRASGSTRFVGRRANERAAREALESSAFVHFATHGILNVRSPMFSRLELARAARVSAPSSDGRLEVHELLDLAVRSPLVFLSGCETGLGSEWSTAFRRGEDYATLAQAFLFAGARNVIATLWRIEDRGAAAFAAAFYRELETSDPVEALARAQRMMMRHPSYRAPYYWAGYVLSGSGALKPPAQKDVIAAVK